MLSPICRGSSAWLERQPPHKGVTHNLEVAGSKPVPGTLMLFFGAQY